MKLGRKDVEGDRENCEEANMELSKAGKTNYGTAYQGDIDLRKHLENLRENTEKKF